MSHGTHPHDTTDPKDGSNPGPGSRPLAVLCLMFVVLADFFFYRRSIGWTVGCYGLLLMGAVILCAKGIPRGRPTVLITTALTLLLLSCFEEPNCLTMVLGILGLATLALMARDGWSANALVWILRWLLLVATGWLKPFRDLLACMRAREDKGGGPRSRFLRNWSLAVIFGGIFLMLFAVANPVISRWLKDAWECTANQFNRLPSFSRILMWLVVGICVWVLLRFRSGIGGPRKEPGSPEAPIADSFLSTGVLVRCLALFNAIFAVQTVLDIYYLYGGAQLPEKMTYAQYAHRGAYPLVVTALLAAFFVLVTLRTGPRADKMRWPRRLVYLWLAQNVFLVISAAWRLRLYIEVYTMTRWRIAAAIWMLLIVAGLLWILMRIVTGHSNFWLINVNTVTAFVVLYACAFVNFDGFIADFNVNRCAEIRRHGPAIDLAYLEDLGPDTLPALARLAEKADLSPEKAKRLDNTITSLREELEKDMRNWRGWTFRRQRLLQIQPVSHNIWYKYREGFRTKVLRTIP